MQLDGKLTEQPALLKQFEAAMFRGMGWRGSFDSQFPVPCCFQPDESSLDFSSCILRHGIKNAKELACGVCLLSVDSRSKVRKTKTLLSILLLPFRTFI